MIIMISQTLFKFFSYDNRIQMMQIEYFAGAYAKAISIRWYFQFFMLIGDILIYVSRWSVDMFLNKLINGFFF